MALRLGRGITLLSRPESGRQAEFIVADDCKNLAALSSFRPIGSVVLYLFVRPDEPSNEPA
jgi:hypothetical protein